MIYSRTYNTVPGATQVFHPTLFGVYKVLSVDRSGFGQDKTTPFSPVNTQFYVFAGRIVFDPAIPFNIGEKVQVIYET